MKSTSVSTAMKKDEFDRIWDETLQPLVKSYQKQFHLKVKNTNCLYYRMRKYFNKQRDLFLKSFMENDVYDIDRHKIASCYMKYEKDFEHYAHGNCNNWYNIHFCKSHGDC